MNERPANRRWIAWIIGLAAVAIVLRFAGGSIMRVLRHAHGMQ